MINLSAILLIIVCCRTFLCQPSSVPLHGHIRGTNDWVKGKRFSTSNSLHGQIRGTSDWVKGKRFIPQKVWNFAESPPIPLTLLYQPLPSSWEQEQQSRSPSITGKEQHLTNRAQMPFPLGKSTPTIHLQLLRDPFLRLVTKLVGLKMESDTSAGSLEQKGPKFD